MYDIGRKFLLWICVGLVAGPTIVFAIPTSWDFANSILQPLLSQQSAQVKVPYLTATSTTKASTLPYASSTQLSALSLCLTGDTCRTTWPASGSGSGNVATGTAETTGYVAIAGSISSNPALINFDSGLTFSTSTDVLTVGGGLISQASSTIIGGFRTDFATTTGTLIVAKTLPDSAVNGPLVGINSPNGIGNVIFSCSGTDCNSIGRNLILVANYAGTGTGVAGSPPVVGINTFMASGTASAPTATQKGSYIYFMGGRGYGTTAWNAGSKAVIAFLAAENFTNTANGTYMTFETTPNLSTTRAERVRIDQSGFVGINQTAPSYQLDVTGNGHFTSYVDALNFIATSSTLASSFPYASSTAITVSDTGYFGSASSTNSINQYASSSVLTVDRNEYFTNLTSALLGTDSTGKVVATTTIGINLLAQNTISGISLGGTLGALTNDTTLNGSSYTGAGAISDWGINLANPNTWTVLQTFGGASTTDITASNSVHLSYLTKSLLATDANGKLFATTTIGNTYLTNAGIMTINTTAPLTGGTTIQPGGSLTVACATCSTAADMFTHVSYAGLTTSATTSALRTTSLLAASTTAFTRASSTQLSVSGNTWLTGITSAVLGVDNNGLIVSTTTIGANLITGLPAGANPTGTIGLSAVNGSATTFLRSDGAPALSQSIAPTWTGLHIFSAKAYIGTSTSALGELTVGSSTAPQLMLSDNTAADNLWAFRVKGNLLYIATSTATATSTPPALSIDGTGAASLFVGTTTNAAIGYGGIAFSGKLFGDGLTNANTGDYVCYNTLSGEFEQNSTACSLSALRFKTDIHRYELGLDAVNKLRPVRFYFKPGIGQDTTKKQEGFIAEEVLKIDPVLVSYNSEGEVSGLDYPKFTVMLTSAVQEFYHKFQDIVARVSGLEKRLNVQEAKIRSLEERLEKAGL